jgi:hypothetical protein
VGRHLSGRREFVTTLLFSRASSSSSFAFL